MAAAAVLAVSACGGQPEPGPAGDGVVTLRTPGAAASPTAGNRPIIRPDMTVEEIWRQDDAMWACMAEHGVPNRQGATAGDRQSIAPVDDAVLTAASEACAHLEPEHWTVVEERTNPEYPDLMREVVACVQRNGHPHAELKQETTWYIAYGGNDSANAAYEVEEECRRQVFADRIKLYE
ncbi:hypothetical protein JCM9533A_30830 [Catenuloplanes niger JCM 9533]